MSGDEKDYSLDELVEALIYEFFILAVNGADCSGAYL